MTASITASVVAIPTVSGTLHGEKIQMNLSEALLRYAAIFFIIGLSTSLGWHLGAWLL